ncbi:MAG: acetyltransferase [Thiolinea sp.]
MNTLYLLGAGGHARVVLDMAQSLGHWERILFLDDAFPERNQVQDIPVCGRLMQLNTLFRTGDDWLVAIGANSARRFWLQHFSHLLPPALTLVHPSAVISRQAHIGAGSVVMPGAIINTGSHIGPGCIINTAATVDHDCQLQEAVHISPGAHLAGGVQVGACSWLGVGSSVRQGIRIGSQVMVGAGAAVVSDIADQLTVVGVPARPLHAASDTLKPKPRTDPAAADTNPMLRMLSASH